MNSFTDAIVPCLLGAGLVLTGIHIKKAIYGYPKAILGACGSITGALDHSKSYYRSLASIVPTFLILLGFTVGAGLDRFWHQSDNHAGYGWVSVVLAGLSAGFGMWLSLKSDALLIRRHVQRSETESSRSEQVGSPNDR